MLIPSLCSCNCDIHEGVTFPYHHKNMHMSGENNGFMVFVGFLSHRVLILPLTQEKGRGISWCHIHSWWHKYVKYSGSLLAFPVLLAPATCPHFQNGRKIYTYHEGIMNYLSMNIIYFHCTFFFFEW